jgi:hypothetical protein
MNITNLSQRNACSLPSELRAAQAAIHLPEVQEILRKLSSFKLGVFMPHMHDESTGEFKPLAHDVVQIESALEVSFKSIMHVSDQGERFLPVGWVWRAGASTESATCEMVFEDGFGDKCVRSQTQNAAQKMAQLVRPCLPFTTF